MRTRLDRTGKGTVFCCICDRAMARKIEPIIQAAGGKVIARDNRSYGVVFQIEKQ